ncbi:uncharacterized protein C10orf95-like [Lagopus leucura]|uniref:uncharacterized protein C10orf95-like n=1 Tax=Lagopus leucura TaxID=30410 RepID=UPI001C67E63A|nr:uncharacterized protein C10orf95-like [Lagopus leucura]
MNARAQVWAHLLYRSCRKYETNKASQMTTVSMSLWHLWCGEAGWVPRRLASSHGPCTCQHQWARLDRATTGRTGRTSSISLSSLCVRAAGSPGAFSKIPACPNSPGGGTAPRSGPARGADLERTAGRTSRGGLAGALRARHCGRSAVGPCGASAGRGQPRVGIAGAAPPAAPRTARAKRSALRLRPRRYSVPLPAVRSRGPPQRQRQPSLWLRGVRGEPGGERARGTRTAPCPAPVSARPPPRAVPVPREQCDRHPPAVAGKLEGRRGERGAGAGSGAAPHRSAGKSRRKAAGGGAGD